MILFICIFFLSTLGVNAEPLYVDVRVQQNLKEITGICATPAVASGPCTTGLKKMFNQVIVDGKLSLSNQDFQLLKNGSFIDHDHSVISNLTMTALGCVEDDCLFRRAATTYEDEWQPLIRTFQTLLVPSKDRSYQNVVVPLLPQAVAQFSENRVMRCLRVTDGAVIQKAKIGSQYISTTTDYEGYRFYALSDNNALDVKRFQSILFEFKVPEEITPIKFDVHATSANDQCTFTITSTITTTMTTTRTTSPTTTPTTSPTTTQTSTPTTTTTPLYIVCKLQWGGYYISEGVTHTDPQYISHAFALGPNSFKTDTVESNCRWDYYVACGHGSAGMHTPNVYQYIAEGSWNKCPEGYSCRGQQDQVWGKKDETFYGHYHSSKVVIEENMFCRDDYLDGGIRTFDGSYNDIPSVCNQNRKSFEKGMCWDSHRHKGSLSFHCNRRHMDTLMFTPYTCVQNPP